MLELGSSGSARGVSSNGHPYRDPRASVPIPNTGTRRLNCAENGARRNWVRGQVRHIAHLQSDEHIVRDVCQKLKSTMLARVVRSRRASH